jgi:hypothetical protein
MVLVVDLFQVFPVDVGIDLGGGDVGVAEHLLDLPSPIYRPSATQ